MVQGKVSCVIRADRWVVGPKGGRTGEGQILKLWPQVMSGRTVGVCSLGPLNWVPIVAPSDGAP